MLESALIQSTLAVSTHINNNNQKYTKYNTASIKVVSEYVLTMKLQCPSHTLNIFRHTSLQETKEFSTNEMPLCMHREAKV